MRRPAARRLLMRGLMRRTERVGVEIAVTWNRDGRDVACSAVDVNEHGLFVRTNEPCAPDSLMRLAVGLPDRVLALVGRARFVGRTASGRGIGVEHFVLDDVGRRRWLAFYEELCAEHASARRAAAMGG